MSPEESSLLRRISERRKGLVEQAERLRKELADIEVELDRVSAADDTIAPRVAEQVEVSDRIAAQLCTRRTLDGTDRRRRR